MKNVLYYLALFVAISVLFSSCNEDDPELFPSEKIKGAYIINYGNYNHEGSSITKYNYESGELINNYYQQQNDLELVSSVQYALTYKDSIYMIGNVKDQLITVNPLFQQHLNGVTDGIANPRYAVADGNYLYISCLGENPDWSKMPDSYIAKFNINTNKVEETIPLPGGPEGMEIAKGKVFVAMNYIDSIAVISTADNQIEYIATPAVSSYFVKDTDNNLYVTLLSTWTDPSEQTGLGYINTSTNELENIYPLEGISTSYSQVISTNNDASQIYVLQASWGQSGIVYNFDVASKEFSSFAGNLTGANAVVSNPVNNDIYILTSPGSSEAGIVKIYNENGSFVEDLICGINPYWVIFQE